MKRLIILFAVMLCVATAFAQKFNYRFNHTPLADALVQIAGQHPDIHINFIYNELGKYPVRQPYAQMMPTICSGRWWD